MIEGYTYHKYWAIIKEKAAIIGRLVTIGQFIIVYVKGFRLWYHIKE
ncbi:MAG: hypothetical protein ACTHKA_10805 [Anaerocolumna jejuensis]